MSFQNSRRVAILEGARTPFSRAWTELAGVPAQELGRIAVAEAIERSGAKHREIGEVIIGNIASPYDAANIARVIAISAGIPRSVPAYTVNRNCGSALQAIVNASERIAHGEAEVVVAGGTESMSRIPFAWSEEAQQIFLQASRARGAVARLSAFARFRPGHFKPVVALERGLTDPISTLNMGQTAELLAKEWGITREEQDAFALESHRRVTAAWSEPVPGRGIGGEIAPVLIPPKFDRVARRDNGHRESQSIQALAKLRPVFDRRYGTVTAGNSSQITDGAAAVVLASEEWAEARGIEPLGFIRSHSVAGCDPGRMGLGPAYAVPRALRDAGIPLGEVDLVEINEAFAAQVIACIRALDSDTFCRDELGLAGRVGALDPEKTNALGGAIALGHPVGATGARLVLTLLRQMRDRGSRFGLATLCIGGGQGAAMVLDREGLS